MFLPNWLKRRIHHFSLRALGRLLPQPPGHFYSPITDPKALAADAARLWPMQADAPGIDLRLEAQAALLRDVFPPLLADFDYPHEPDRDLQRYHSGNNQFGAADARTLFALLRHWRPARMVEIGSGFSTLLAADVNRRFLGGCLQLTAIEPYPREFLHGLPGLHALRIERVQDTPQAVFDALTAGDVLFIDSSHVLKTGSDLTHLLTRVLPALAPGVRIHFHDVFLPDDYPQQWAVTENRSWNEQYALQAMLAHNPRYRVLFATHCALVRLCDDARAAFGPMAGLPWQGGSLWIEIVGI